MSNVKITVTSFSNSTLQDLLGLEAYAKPGTWISQYLAFGLTVSFEVPGTVWTRLRPLLNGLANRRIPAMDASGNPLGTGKTQPAIFYSMDWVPGDRPRISKVATTSLPLSLAAPGNLTLAGTNLIAGLAAFSIIQTWSAKYSYGLPGTKTYTKPVDALLITAVDKGPGGNKIAYSIEQAGVASVHTYMNPDGDLYIKVTPATGFSDSTSIAAQINADPLANLFVSATALIASVPIAPTMAPIGGNGPSPGGVTPSQSGQITKVYLTGGEGGGLAKLDVLVSGTDPTNRLNLVANKVGNGQNQITLTINVSQAGNTVVVTGNNIVINRIAATSTIAALQGVLAGSPAAAALVTASNIGVGSLGALAKSWLYNGGGETPVVTIGGAAASVISQTDTSMVIATTNAALVAAGAGVGDVAQIQIQMNYGLVAAPIGAIAA